MPKKKTVESAEQKQLLADGISPSSITSRSKSLVFISHDSRDADLAEVFANLLSDVSGGTLKSFRSSDKKGTSGIEFGTEWYKAIMSQLGDATDVVALLTSRSIDRPWILYEAGVAKGKLDTNVLGIAVGVPLEKVSTGPFGQFQNCSDDEDSLTKLVTQLLLRNPDAEPREEAIRRQVHAFRESIDKLLSDKGKNVVQPETDESSAAKLFEEIKAMVRELPDQVDSRIRHITKRGSFIHSRQFRPIMFDEILFHPALREVKEGPAMVWLLFISLLREDLPWLYEIGLDLYRALRSGKAANVAKAREMFLRMADATTRGPFFHELSRTKGEEWFRFTRNLPELTEEFLMRVMPQPKAVKTIHSQKATKKVKTEN